MSDDIRGGLILLCDSMPEVRLTSAHLEAAKSDAGGWTRKQLALLGVDWPYPKGWVKRVVGLRFAGSVVAELIRIRKTKQPSLW